MVYVRVNHIQPFSFANCACFAFYLDANKFKDAFEKYQPKPQEEEDTLTKKMGELQVEENEKQQSNVTEQKDTGDSDNQKVTNDDSKNKLETKSEEGDSPPQGSEPATSGENEN